MAARTDRSNRGRHGSKMPSLAQPRPASQNQQEKEAIPIWEWIVAAVGLLLVSGVIGFLLYEAFTGSRLPPDVKVSVNSVVQTGNGFLVRVTAVNEGGMTGEGVIVEAELRSGTELMERSWTTVDYLPPRSEKKAGLFFVRDPRQFDIRVRSLGFEEP
jgi:uncharacterized protein (TIGR02588 family)